MKKDMPLLELLNELIKMAQARNINVVNFVEGVKLVQVDIWQYYNVIEIAFKDNVFVA